MKGQSELEKLRPASPFSSEGKAGYEPNRLWGANEMVEIGDPWLSVGEIYKYIGASNGTVYKWIGKYGMLAHRMGVCGS